MTASCDLTPYALAEEAPRARARPDPTFDAQMAGQENRRRGLKGGKPVLDAARAAYLSAEWRGDEDRRLPAGALKRVEL